MSNSSDGQETNRTDGHCAQDQKSFPQSIYVKYGEHVTEDTERCVYCL